MTGHEIAEQQERDTARARRKAEKLAKQQELADSAQDIARTLRSQLADEATRQYMEDFAGTNEIESTVDSSSPEASSSNRRLISPILSPIRTTVLETSDSLVFLASFNESNTFAPTENILQQFRASQGVEGLAS